MEYNAVQTTKVIDEIAQEADDVGDDDPGFETLK